MKSTLRSALAPLSPRGRRFRRFLRDLPLDADRLPAQLEPMGDRDFIVCGCPRTGTSLLAAVLFQPPEIVTAMEPWDGMRMAPPALLRSLRAELLETGCLSRGRLDLDALEQREAVAWSADGASTRPVAADHSTWVGVKWTGYWRFLDRIQGGQWVVCLRHPAEVVASFRDAGGRVALGLQYDTTFNRALNDHLLRATDDVELRRVLLFDYVHERLLPHLARPDVFVLRYERWSTGPQDVVRELSEFFDVPLAMNVALKPARQPRLSDRERDLLRVHCRTAEALGYDVSGP